MSTPKFINKNVQYSTYNHTYVQHNTIHIIIHMYSTVRIIIHMYMPDNSISSQFSLSDQWLLS